MMKKTGIIISIALGLILASAAIYLSFSFIFPEMDNKVIPLISENWLILIFKLHAKIINTSINPLHEINFYDIFILILFIMICISLYLTLKRQNKIWFITAISLLLLGIILFIITQIAGRSSFMAAGLIISLVLLIKVANQRTTGIIGILANTLLLIGDFTVGSELKIIPVLFGLGYILDTFWMFLLASIFVQSDIQSNIPDRQIMT